MVLSKSKQKGQLLMEQKFYSIHSVSKMLGVTPQTLRNWERNGTLIPCRKSGNGYRYYSEEQITNLMQDKKSNKIVIGYCRVSSKKQKDDLERQVESVKQYLLNNGEPFRIIEDIGSGINYNKNGLIELIRLINSNQVKKVVILYKDRLLRFGFDLIKNFAKLHCCQIEIIDQTPKTEQQELVEDLVQIITVFSCELNGKCANKTKKMIKELINDD